MPVPEAPVYHSPYADADADDRNPFPPAPAPADDSEPRRRRGKKLKPEQIVYYVGKQPRNLPRGALVPQSASGPAAASGSGNRRSTANTQTAAWLATQKFFDGPLLPAYPQNPNLPPPPGFMPPPPPGYVIRGYIPPPDAAMPAPVRPMLRPPGPGQPLDPKFRAAFTHDMQHPRAIEPHPNTQSTESAPGPGPDPSPTTIYMPQRHQPPQGFYQATQSGAPQQQHQYLPAVPPAPVYIPATSALMAARQRGDPAYTTQHEWLQRKDPEQASEGVLGTYVAIDVAGCKSSLLRPPLERKKAST